MWGGGAVLSKSQGFPERQTHCKMKSAMARVHRAQLGRRRLTRSARNLDSGLQRGGLGSRWRRMHLEDFSEEAVMGIAKGRGSVWRKRRPER